MEELTCLLDTPGLRISSDEANNWLYNQWLGMHNEDSVKMYASHICACLRQRPFTKILSDHSGLVGNWQGAAPWIGQEYFVRLAAQGIAYFAWVYNEHYHDRLAMEQTLYYTTSPVVAIFDDVASAYEWLQHCPTPRPAR
jgi:hypothetical protein